MNIVVGFDNLCSFCYPGSEFLNGTSSSILQFLYLSLPGFGFIHLNFMIEFDDFCSFCYMALELNILSKVQVSNLLALRHNYTSVL